MSINQATVQGNWHVKLEDTGTATSHASTILKLEGNSIATCPTMGKFGKYSCRGNFVLIGFTDGFMAPTNFYLIGEFVITPDGDTEIHGIIGSPLDGSKAGRFAASKTKVPNLPEATNINVSKVGGLTITALEQPFTTNSVYTFSQGQSDFEGKLEVGVVGQQYRWAATYANYKFNANGKQLLVFAGNANRLYGGVVNGNKVENGMWVYQSNEGTWG